MNPFARYPEAVAAALKALDAAEPGHRAWLEYAAAGDGRRRGSDVRVGERDVRIALAAAVPLIREQIAAEIEAELITPAAYVQVHTNGGMKRAARIARGVQS